MWFGTVKRYYETEMLGYDKEGIKIFVEANMITQKDYYEITGTNYIK